MVNLKISDLAANPRSDLRDGPYSDLASTVEARLGRFWSFLFEIEKKNYFGYRLGIETYPNRSARAHRKLVSSHQAESML